MNQSSNYFGAIATSKAICDLTLKGFHVFTPVVGDFLRYDLIAVKDDKFYKIQCKYSSSGVLAKETYIPTGKDLIKKPYTKDDFDYYAMYLPDIDTVVYPSVSFAGRTISSRERAVGAKFYYYKDFLDFTDEATKRSFRDFDLKLKMPEQQTKIKWPTKEEFDILVWKKPMLKISEDLGVSNTAIKKHCLSLGVKLPPRGFWLKKIR